MKYDCLGECSPVNIGWHTYEKTTVQFEIFIIKNIDKHRLSGHSWERFKRLLKKNLRIKRSAIKPLHFGSNMSPL